MAVLLASLLLGASPIEPKNSEDNALYQEFRTQGVMLGGEKRVLPEPSLGRDVDKDEERQILLKIAGNPAFLSDFLQNSKVAPAKMKSHDIRTGKGTLCLRDVWFVIYAELGEVDTQAGPFGDAAKKQVSDEGGIKITSEKVDDQELKSRGISIQNGRRVTELYIRQTGELFGDVFVQATNHILATGDADSWVIALRTDPHFSNDPKLASQWRPVRPPRGSTAVPNPTPYEGGCSYTKITKLKSRPGALLVETHFAFWEPWGWFEGGTILRAKLQAGAEANARRLRTEIAKRKQEAKANKASSSSRSRGS